MKKCKKCGSKDFIVNEDYTWEGRLEEGKLYIKHEASEFRNVICTECQTEYNTEEFESIETV